MSKVKERLRNKSNPQTPPAPSKAAEAPAAPAPAAAAKSEDAPAAPDPEDEDLMDAKVEADAKTPEAAKEEKKEDAPAAAAADDKAKKDKVNPWKLVDEHKSHRAKLEQENAELKKLIPNVEQRKSELAEMESVKKRNQELEQHIQFVDYQKSEEFQTKYKAPYESQWKTSMAELKGVLVETETGERELAAQDIVDLVNMPKLQARQIANERFGEFANDVMAERDKIRSSWDAQQKALDEAKTRGTTKSQEVMKAQREAYEKTNGEVHEIYQKAIDSISKDPSVAPYISQRDGDSKHNELLTKATSLVDEAFSTNPLDPALTPKQRESIVKKHAAVRFRAIGYGVVKRDLVSERAAHAETKRRLAEYEGTVPNRGGSEPVAQAANGGSTAMARMQARLRARASK